MKALSETTDFFYSSHLFCLRITADHETIKSIDFISARSLKSTSLPLNVSMLFNWLDDYSVRKENKYSIIFRTDGSADYPLSMAANRIVLDASGYTDRQLRVYTELLNVPAGETISYGALAAKSGIPRGGRFVGNAMAGNRFPVIVPCHRVIKSSGAMGNFSGGVDIKRKLLNHEAGGFFIL